MGWNSTALVIPVREAEFVQPFRARHLRRPGVTMPPHVTLRSPFKYMQDIDRSVFDDLTHLFARHARFRFALRATARFPDTGVLYLAPEPAAPFLRLSQAIREKYRDPPPAFASPVMHLTLARSDTEELDRIEDEFHREYGGRLPIKATATEACLFEKREEAWVKRASFTLADAHQ